MVHRSFWLTEKIGFLQFEHKVHVTRTMMKLLILSALLVFVKSDDDVLQDYRKIMSLHRSDISKIQESTKSFAEFNTKKFPWSTNEIDQSALAEEVHDDSSATNKQFAVRLHEYYSYKLQMYCQQLIALIEVKRIEEDEKNLVNIIKLDQNHLCLASFIFHFGIPVDPMFRIVRILQYVSDTTDLRFIMTELNLFIKTNVERIKALYTSNEPGATSHDDFLPKVSDDILSDSKFNKLRSEVLGIKETLLKFSTVFCFSNIPSLVVNKFMKVHHKLDHFLDYLYREEKFTVKFVQEIEYKQNKITQWDCLNVWSSPEYNIDQYMTDISINKEKETDQNTKIAVAEGSSSSSVLQPESDTTDDITTIDQLQDKLKSNNYYFNYVKLSNIILEVATLVAMKEGRKILKVVNDTKSRCSNKINTIDSYLIPQINASLTHFQSIYSELTDIIDSIIPLTNSIRDLKKIFDTQLTQTMELFNKSSYVKLSEFQSLLNSTDTNISTLDKVVHGKLYFKNFYLTSPLIDIKRLNDFVRKFIYS